MRDCGTHTYEKVDRAGVDAILEALAGNGATVSGSNPWDVDTGRHGVMLSGLWNEETMTLAITVTDADWYVPCSRIWENIDGLLCRVPGRE